MNDIITIYVDGSSKGLSYNPMYKFKDTDEFIQRVETNQDVPNGTDMVIEGYRGDNLVYVNNTFKGFVDMIRIIFDT